MKSVRIGFMPVMSGDIIDYVALFFLVMFGTILPCNVCVFFRDLKHYSSVICGKGLFSLVLPWT